MYVSAKPPVAYTKNNSIAPYVGPYTARSYQWRLTCTKEAKIPRN